MTPMRTSDVIQDAFKRLIQEGKTLLAKYGWNGTDFALHVPSADDHFRFRTQVMNLVRRSCGDDSDHYQQLKRLAEDKNICLNGFYLINYFGVLQAAHHDFEAGLLFDLRRLISADLLGDFIDQSEALLRADYYVAAASLSGAVLENTLRKLSEKHSIQPPSATNINSLNTELARAAVYDKLVQKRITALADIRNNADHGHFDKFKRGDVEDMVKWVRSFAADYLQ